MSRRVSGLMLLTLGLLPSCKPPAPDVFPPFDRTQIDIRLPPDTPGLQADPDHISDDLLVYSLHGQVFGPGAGRLQTAADGFSGSTPRQTPWMTLTELLHACATRDYQHYASLLSPQSRAEMANALPTPHSRRRFMESLQEVFANVRVRLGFHHDEGFAVILEAPEAVYHAVFLERLDGCYLVSQRPTDALVENVMLYLKRGVAPPRKPTVISVPSEVQRQQQAEIVVELTRAGAYASIISPAPEIVACVRDNGPYDTMADAKRVAVSFPVLTFAAGVVEVRAIETAVSTFRSPVSEQMLDAGAAVTFTVVDE